MLLFTSEISESSKKGIRLYGRVW